MVAPAPVAITEPAYTEMVEAPPAYSPPLYDVTTPPAAVITEPAAGAPVAPAYRYVYEPDRILAIDPVTGIAVQAIPR